jgi:DNA-directed RNA polymerase
MLNFSVGRKLTEEGKREVKLAIAGAYGLTGTDQEKLDWFEQASQDWLAHVVKAKDQLLFKKLVSHWEEAKSNPDYLWNAPLGLDAHASGIQILSVVSGDLNGCRMTNLIDKEVFYDLYTSMAEAMERITGVAISDRDDIKLAVMTAFYGSKALPFEIYGENEKYFWELLEKELPGAYSSFERIQSAWRSDVSHHQWTMPDGHFVSVPVRETEEVTVEVDELGHAKLNFEISVCKPQKTGVALAANVTHSMDAYLLRETVRRFYMLGGRQIGTVHDCFYVHPNDAGKVREAYREALVSIAETDLLGFILTQIEGDGITRTDKIDKDLPDLIRQGRYAIA